MTDASDSPTAQPHGARPSDLPPPPLLRAEAKHALFLDFDGTLVELAETPDSVIVAPSVPDVLARLAARLDGRLAIVTGRALDAIDALLGPTAVAMAGSHGGEFRPAGSRDVLPGAEALPGDVTQAMATFATTHGGLLVEPKRFSVAVHYRRHPDALAPLLDLAGALAAERGLAMKHGKQVIELVMPGSDKGSAVSRFMALPAFAGATPLFLGDDVTDEDAFVAAAQFGGGGILVGDMRETAARWRLPDVSAVHEWLQAAARPAQPEEDPEA